MDLSNIFSIGYHVTDYLSKAGIRFSKDAIIFHKSHKIQYRYRLNIGSQTLRTSDFIRVIKSRVAKPLEIGRVLTITGFTMPSHEILGNNILRAESNRTTIDIPKLLQTVKSEEVIIQFEKDIPRDHLNMLIPIPHVFKNAIYHGDSKAEIPVEIQTDYANFWYKYFDWFAIRDIRLRHSVLLLESSFFLLFSDPLKNKVKKIFNTASLTRDMMIFLQRSSNILRKFQSDKSIQRQLSMLLYTDKPKNIEFKRIKGQTLDKNIHGRKFTIPSIINFEIILSIDGKDLAVSGRIFIDFEKLYRVVRSLIDEIEEATNDLKI